MSKSLAQAYLDVSLRLPIDDIKVKQRLDRAYNILNDYGYAIALLTAPAVYKQGDRAVYIVKKASTSLLEDNSAQYTVSSAYCDCPDYVSARSNLCKHRLAIMLLEDMQA